MCFLFKIMLDVMSSSTNVLCNFKHAIKPTNVVFILYTVVFMSKCFIYTFYMFPDFT